MFTYNHVVALTGPRLSKPWRNASWWASSCCTERLKRTRKVLVKTSRDSAAAMSNVAAKHCSHMFAQWPVAADWGPTAADVTTYRPAPSACANPTIQAHACLHSATSSLFTDYEKTPQAVTLPLFWIKQPRFMLFRLMWPHLRADLVHGNKARTVIYLNIKCCLLLR